MIADALRRGHCIIFVCCEKVDKFVLGHVQSCPGPRVACGPQVDEPDGELPLGGQRVETCAQAGVPSVRGAERRGRAGLFTAAFSEGHFTWLA